MGARAVGETQLGGPQPKRCERQREEIHNCFLKLPICPKIFPLANEKSTDLEPGKCSLQKSASATQSRAREGAAQGSEGKEDRSLPAGPPFLVPVPPSSPHPSRLQPWLLRSRDSTCPCVSPPSSCSSARKPPPCLFSISALPSSVCSTPCFDISPSVGNALESGLRFSDRTLANTAMPHFWNGHSATC